MINYNLTDHPFMISTKSEHRTGIAIADLRNAKSRTLNDEIVHMYNMRWSVDDFQNKGDSKVQINLRRCSRQLSSMKQVANRG